MVPFMSMLLLYFSIILFVFYRFKNKKPLKWNDIMHAITFNQCTQPNDDTLRVPGPLRLPLFGTKWNCMFSNMNKLHEYYAELNQKYGDVAMELKGSVPIISLFKRQDIEKVLKVPTKFPFRPPTDITVTYRRSRPDRYASVGMVNIQGPEWAHLRMKLTPKTLENRKVLAAFCPDLNEVCDDLIKVIKERRNQQNVVENFEEILGSMSFETACCLILGRRIGVLNSLNESSEENKKFLELATAAKNIFKCCRDAFYGVGLWKYFPTKTYRDYVKNEELVYDIISEIISKTIKDEEAMGSENDKPSLLLTILKTERLDMREKISGTIDFLIAGIELISHTVSFLLYYLTLNPEAQEKIFLETQDMNEVLTQEDLSRAFYTRAAIHEAFRLSPAAFAVARILEEDSYLSGYHLKQGTVVLCQNMIACSKNENFEEASEYKPDRWMNECGEFDKNRCVGSSIVLPFGSGKRICPGKKFTELELTIACIKLVRAFKIKYSSEFDREFQFVLAPKSPVNIQFCDRL